MDGSVSKGSGRRPSQITKAEWERRYQTTFPEKPKAKPEYNGRTPEQERVLVNLGLIQRDAPAKT